MNVSRGIIIYKFVLGLVELLLSIGIMVYGKKMYIIYAHFRSQSLLEDPHDLIVVVTEKFLPYLLMHRGYLILILFILGVVKMIGAVGLYYRKHWGLDLLVGLTFILLPFELYQLLSKFTLLKLIFLVINGFISLYLVEFRPKDYFTSFKERVKKQREP